jgi:excinuclease ABC A subunit
MCLRCFGTGRVSTVSEETILNNWDFKGVALIRRTPGKLKDGLKRLGKSYGFNPRVSFYDLSPESQQAFMHGDLSIGFEGLIPYLHRISAGSNGLHTDICPSCRGARIGEEAQMVTIGGLNISVLANKTLREQILFWDEVTEDLIKADSNLGTVIGTIRSKLKNLYDVGLSHLSLYRKTPTLSGGELQRLFLASHLDPDLEGLIHIFDEPTVGLHEQEKGRLIERIKEFKNHGSTVIVVEHDPHVIQAADWIIEIGPGAGEAGGKIVYQGELSGYLHCTQSCISPFLFKRRFSTVRERKSVVFKMNETTPCLRVHHASIHNLKDVSVSIPLEVMVGVVGASGSGKSSLIASTLVPLLAKSFNHLPDDEQDLEEYNTNALSGTELEGIEQLTGVSVITQAPIGRAKTSIPASYIGIWDRVRNLLASQKEAIEHGFTAGDFSFNSTGACSECNGEGTIKKETKGFAFTWPCHICGGTRFRKDVLEIKIDGKNIADILELSVSEAVQFFQHESSILRPLLILEQVGMGYLKLGQSTTTISGGEAQRIKLAKELGRAQSGGNLYILDEPTNGLSCADVSSLMELLRGLVERGNSLIIIEHDLMVLKECDWIIEMGPGGGDEGGEVIASGSPEQLSINSTSIIGAYIREEATAHEQ